MNTLFKKLQLHSTLDEILILNEPEGFCTVLDTLDGVTIKESLIQVSEVDFALIFVTEKKQIENRIETVYPKLIGDAVLWFAFPKEGSKKYKTEITTEHGWGVLGDYNLRSIAQVDINNDWTAIRFRKIKFLDTAQETLSQGTITT